LSAEDRTIRVEVRVSLPSGERLTKVLTAEPAWRQALDLPLGEYVNLILQRAAAEAHRWVAVHAPTEEGYGESSEST
jgi:hypothetical protein